MFKGHTYIVALDAAGEYSLDEDFTNKYMNDPNRAKHLVKVVTVRQMLHAITGKLGGWHLGGLMLLGHGHPGVQGVGLSSLGHGPKPKQAEPHLGSGPSGAYDIAHDPDGIRSLRVDSGGGLLGDGARIEQLGGKFTPRGMVVLGGCEVGKGDEGDALLVAVSDALGNVRVQAGVETQYPLKPGCEGKCKEAHNGKVYYVDGEHQSRLWSK